MESNYVVKYRAARNITHSILKDQPYIAKTKEEFKLFGKKDGYDRALKSRM